MTKLTPITLVIADTGPLISLAVIDRLDLLQCFGTPVFVTDAVMYECIALASRPGSDRLREWFESGGGNQHRIITTPLGAAYREAEKLVVQGHADATRHFGEWATSWALDNIDVLLKDMKLNPGTHFGLVLAEDNDFLNNKVPFAQIPANTHVLSTRALFVALERLGVVPSAEDLRESVKRSGRPKFSKSLIDRPYKDAGVQTDYEGRIRETREEAAPPKPPFS